MTLNERIAKYGEPTFTIPVDDYDILQDILDDLLAGRPYKISSYDRDEHRQFILNLRFKLIQQYKDWELK